MTPKTITVIGSLNTDLVSVTARVHSGGETLTGTSFHTGPGGKGANQAVAAARLSRANPHKSKGGDAQEADVVVKMVGAVGNDEFGPKIIAGMKEDGIDVSGIQLVKDQPTGVAVIIVEVCLCFSISSRLHTSLLYHIPNLLSPSFYNSRGLCRFNEPSFFTVDIRRTRTHH